MAVYKRSNGNYFVQFNFQGKTYIKSANSKKKSDAVELERKMREDLRKYVVLGLPKEITCEDAINNYLESKREASSFKTTSAIGRWYIQRLKGLYLHQITTAKFYELINEKKAEGASPNTLMSYKQLLLGTNKLAKKMGNMASEFESPNVKRSKNKLRYLTIEEEARLLEELDPRLNHRGVAAPGERSLKYERFIQDNYDFVVLLLDTGARLSEIASLKWSDVDIDEGTVKLWRSKVQNESILKLSDRSWLVVRRRFRTRENEFVFANREGTGPKQTMTGIRNAIERAGLKDVTIHTLRHTFASRQIQNGTSLYEVKELLGHSSLNTTQMYAHLDQDQITDKARDVMNLSNKQVRKLQLRVVG